MEVVPSYSEVLARPCGSQVTSPDTGCQGLLSSQRQRHMMFSLRCSVFPYYVSTVRGILARLLRFANWVELA